MSQESPAPNWNLLPHSPQAFFELQDGYNRKDLKRAYNRWLRIFRPEKFPAEFQRLREAYEYLESQERYALPKQPVAQVNNSSSLAEATATSPDHELSHNGRLANVAEEKPIRSELNWKSSLPNVDIRALYEYLKQKKYRSADDYIAIAVLTDASKTPNPKNFVLWLIEGLKEHPRDSSLSYLLRSTFSSSQMDSSAMEEILSRLSITIDSNQFYYLAEPLLDKYMRDNSWAEFKRILSFCQSKLNDHFSDGRTAYICHSLRQAIWKAPLAELRQIIASIEKEGGLHGNQSEFDFEINVRLVDYIQNREQFVKLGPISKMIDQAIRSFCMDNDALGAHNISKCQQYIAQHPGEIFSEFTLPSSNMVAGEAWMWVSEYVRQELGEYPEEPAASSTAMDQLEQHFQKAPANLAAMACQTVRVAITLAAILLGVITLLAAVVPGIMFLSFYFRKVKPYVDRRLNNVTRGLQLIRYRRWCRDSIGRYHAATHITFQEMLSKFERYKAVGHELSFLPLIPSFYGNDMGMAFYSAALKFER